MIILDEILLEDSMTDVGIPSSISRVIMHCVSMVIMHALYNGQTTNTFKLT